MFVLQSPKAREVLQIDESFFAKEVNSRWTTESSEYMQQVMKRRFNLRLLFYRDIEHISAET